MTNSVIPADGGTTTQPRMFDFRGAEVRVITGVDGEPRWIASDVSKVLGYRDAEKMTRNIRDRHKGTHNVGTRSANGVEQARPMTVITEAGLYAAVLKSRVPAAIEFQDWITDEVLPSIRKHGGYLTDQTVEEVLNDPDTIIQLATNLKAERARRAALEQQATVDAPKVEAYDRFIDADGTYSVGNVAKMLGLSQNKLFDLLRNEGILIAKGAMRNTPYQRYMHHFTVKAYEYERTNGERGTGYTTRVQPTGISFIQRKLNRQAEVLS